MSTASPKSSDPADHSGTELLRQRNRELSILNSIAEALNREVDLTRTVHTALEQVAELLDLSTGWVWLLHPESGESYLAASLNLPPGLAAIPRLMEGSCYCLRTYSEGDLEGAANVNVVTCSRLAALVDGTDGLRYHASIPLYAPGDVRLGVLNVASADWRGLSEEDLRILYTVGDLLSIAVERARLFQQSAELGATEERNRLAREIHDTLAQGLAAITMQLEAAEVHLGDDAGRLPVRDAVGRALALAQDTLQEARRSVLDLRAAPLEGRTLSEAVAGLVGGLRGEAGIQAEFESVGVARPLAARIESGTYRIAQEAITNVVRHAGASRVTVRLAATPAELKLSVEDNGRGFEQSTVPEGRYGLVGINERARLLGGSMRLESSPGLGTRIEVRVPLDSTGAKESAS